MKKSVCILMVLLWVLNNVSAQEISTHQWKERVLIVMATDKNSKLLQEQIAIFNKNESGLKERKLEIYIVTPNNYSMFNSADGNQVSSNRLYKSYKSKDSELELVLIGLDGGIKHRTFTLTTTQEIFAVIDGMPMRKSEMKRDQN
ncbi:MAG: DUF4174 domain-containing protein [Flavobacteriaceae bacterium]|nr:DUF4174 domain-containing protein [Flavobacteriaceae bacterium]